MSSDLASPDMPKSDPTLPVPREVDYEWMSLETWRGKHASHTAVAALGGIDLLLVGDSLTEGWSGTRAWNEFLGGYRSANFGIGGDATQNMLWRLQNGAVGALSPHVIVLLAGINNLGRENHSAEETARGVGAVVACLRSRFPRAIILLFGVFPADAAPDTDLRRRIRATNALLARLHDGRHVHFHDIGDRFLDSAGVLAPEISPDALHLSEEGYRRYAEALAPLVRKLMDEDIGP